MLTYDSADGGTIFLEDEKSLGAGGRGNVFPGAVRFRARRYGAQDRSGVQGARRGASLGGAPSQGGGACPHEESRGDLRCVAGVVDLRRGSVGGFTMYRLAGSSLDAVVADPATGSPAARRYGRACVRYRGGHASAWRGDR